MLKKGRARSLALPPTGPTTRPHCGDQPAWSVPAPCRSSSASCPERQPESWLSPHPPSDPPPPLAAFAWSFPRKHILRSQPQPAPPNPEGAEQAFSFKKTRRKPTPFNFHLLLKHHCSTKLEMLIMWLARLCASTLRETPICSESVINGLSQG